MSGKQAERREQWRQRIAQQEKSGQSMRAYCLERGVNEHRFYAWRKRLLEENHPVRFALIETKPAVTATAQPIELMLASGDRLLIPADAASLRLVLKVVREPA